MVPIRTCVGCRSQTEQDSAVRFVLDGDQVVLDAERKRPGRGAWLHRSRQCFETALKRRSFNRAFRKPVDTAQLAFEDFERLTTAKKAGWKEMNTR
ncbi:YlxR family protein [Nesterenkonia natronophila]|uniref:YlxR family protein n=1 Tax=Nesterenkonia natronophila TaxID=2174932 RepID=A0A3A4FHY2_9MICC|nr:YlxR family protein [Nesterenkonia natronophila]RJN31915.1 YlxR family protein [Nesterenkonia natronophila]